MHADKLLPWLRLKTVSGIGNHLTKRLLDRFRCPEAVFEADPGELLQTEGLTPRLVDRLKRHRLPPAAETELEMLHRSGFDAVTYSDRRYPSLLKEIPDPPPFLYVYGQLEADSGNVAMVGSRNATDYGIDAAHRLSSALARSGVTVVSGMALGIDTASHEGALQGGGRTVAVLGSGLLNVYPAANRKLFHRIAAAGAVISEFALQAKPEAHHFPLRNRVISGVSLGVIVVEASTRSGSLITARLANEQNREVFAVPGSIQSFKSAGTHTLIKAGAKLVENARDVIEELLPRLRIEPPPVDEGEAPAAGRTPLNAEETRVLAALDAYPVHIDALQQRLEMPPARLSSILMTLELKGAARQLPGKFFRRADRRARS